MASDYRLTKGRVKTILTLATIPFDLNGSTVLHGLSFGCKDITSRNPRPPAGISRTYNAKNTSPPPLILFAYTSPIHFSSSSAGINISLARIAKNGPLFPPPPRFTPIILSSSSPLPHSSYSLLLSSPILLSSSILLLSAFPVSLFKLVKKLNSGNLFLCDTGVTDKSTK